MGEGQTGALMTTARSGVSTGTGTGVSGTEVGLWAGNRVGVTWDVRVASRFAAAEGVGSGVREVGIASGSDGDSLPQALSINTTARPNEAADNKQVRSFSTVVGIIPIGSHESGAPTPGP